tara:strand:+ start:476 stop:859 length:384 start_codon:yes stop_codon:yes gene_type:complete
MSQFTRKQLDTIRKQMQNSLSLFADKTDIQIEVGNCSYRGGEATFKVKVLMEGAKTREQEDLEYYAELHKLDLTKIAKLQGEDMSLVGYKARARKKPWVLQRLRDGAEFVCEDRLASQFFKKEEANA